MRAIYRWFTGSRFGQSETRAPAEAIILRCFATAYLVVFLVETFTSQPHPGLHGRGAVILAATLACAAAAISAQPQSGDLSARRRVAALLAMTAAAAVLAIVQPHGIWTAGPIFVAIVAAVRLERVPGALTLACSLAVLLAVSLLAGYGGSLSVANQRRPDVPGGAANAPAARAGDVLAESRAARRRAGRRARPARARDARRARSFPLGTGATAREHSPARRRPWCRR